jgi:competence protein ComFA
LDCRSLGAVTSLQAIYQDQRRISPPQGEIRFSPNRELTEAQAQAAREVLSFVQGEQGRMLLWAACGAGKTEVCFPALAWALREGRSVLLAAPRQDVIHDIAPRLQQDFPDLPLQVLTGSSETRFDVGGLVLATTHQVLRFARVFDLVILDEVDAFPYADNEALRWGMENSLRQDGKMLYLTATPAAEQLAGVKKGELSLVRLPARHHRQPVPVPVWERWPLSGDEKDQRACPPKLQEKVRQLAEKGTVLLFVPKISLVESWAEIMRRCFPDWPVDGSYSQDPQRQMKISALKNQAYRIFISTLILERGVTINGVQVIVLAADHPIFDERSLVQMAGRAGRTTEQPQGSVYYFAKRMTAAMKTAVRQIEEQNAIALAKNLIDAGGENDPTSSARGEEMASVDLV